MHILVKVNDKRAHISDKTYGKQTANCIIDVSSLTSVENIKEQLSKKIGIPIHYLTIIFGGKVLTSETSVASLLFGPQTALTALVTESVFVDQVFGPSSTEISSSKYASSFQIYCKRCSNVKQGKLRVCCAKCESTSVLLKRDPVDWNDVLLPSRIFADCLNCNSESVVRFYYKCTCCSEVSVPLTHCRGNISDVYCCICFERISGVISDFGCHHYMCIDCFVAYMKTCFEQRRFIFKQPYGYTLSCPIYQCNACVTDPHHFYLLGKEKYELYKQQAAEKFVSLEEGGTFCPNRNCGEAFITDKDHGNEKVLCPYCKHYFCLNCRLENCFCPDGDATSEVIRKISKKCPGCGVNTERNGGCSHMHCANCGVAWCFVCVKQWNEDCQWNHWFE